MAKDNQGEGGRKAGEQGQDKRLRKTGEQEAPCPIHLDPCTTHYPHINTLMHSSPCAGRQQCAICSDSSSSSGSPMTVSRVDTARMPRIPCTPPVPATVEEVPLLSETLQTPPTAPIPPTSMTINTHRAHIIQ